MENVITIPAVDTEAATAALSTCVKEMLNRAIELAVAEAEDRHSRSWAEWECKLAAQHEEEMEASVIATAADVCRKIAAALRREAASAGPSASAVLRTAADDIDAGRLVL